MEFNVGPWVVTARKREGRRVGRPFRLKNPGQALPPVTGHHHHDPAYQSGRPTMMRCREDDGCDGWLSTICTDPDCPDAAGDRA